MARVKKLRGLARRSRQRFTTKTVVPHASFDDSFFGGVVLTARSDLPGPHDPDCRTITTWSHRNGLGQPVGRMHISIGRCPRAEQERARDWLYNLLSTDTTE